jgi:hypothetical protein
MNLFRDDCANLEFGVAGRSVDIHDDAASWCAIRDDHAEPAGPRDHDVRIESGHMDGRQALTGHGKRLPVNGYSGTGHSPDRLDRRHAAVANLRHGG